MAIDQWLAQYQDKIGGMRQAAAELGEGIAAATVTTSSPDESVTVTIAPNGGLRDLRFSHRAAEHSYAELAALVMKTVAKGQRAVAGKVAEAFAPVGAGTSAMDMLTGFAPEVPADEPARPRNAYDELAADIPSAPVPAPAVRPRPRPAVDVDDFDERPW